jgi:hypothetical protein
MNTISPAARDTASLATRIEGACFRCRGPAPGQYLTVAARHKHSLQPATLATVLGPSG